MHEGRVAGVWRDRVVQGRPASASAVERDLPRWCTTTACSRARLALTREGVLYSSLACGVTRTDVSWAPTALCRSAPLVSQQCVLHRMRCSAHGGRGHCRAFRLSFQSFQTEMAHRVRPLSRRARACCAHGILRLLTTALICGRRVGAACGGSLLPTGGGGSTPPPYAHGVAPYFQLYGTGQFDGQGSGHDFFGTIFLPSTGNSVAQCETLVWFCLLLLLSTVCCVSPHVLHAVKLLWLNL